MSTKKNVDAGATADKVSAHAQLKKDTAAAKRVMSRGLSQYILANLAKWFPDKDQVLTSREVLQLVKSTFPQADVLQLNSALAGMAKNRVGIRRTGSSRSGLYVRLEEGVVITPPKEMTVDEAVNVILEELGQALRDKT